MTHHAVASAGAAAAHDVTGLASNKAASTAKPALRLPVNLFSFIPSLLTVCLKMKQLLKNSTTENEDNSWRHKKDTGNYMNIKAKV
jgi:hypothetical protein